MYYRENGNVIPAEVVERLENVSSKFTSAVDNKRTFPCWLLWSVIFIIILLTVCCIMAINKKSDD